LYYDSKPKKKLTLVVSETAETIGNLRVLLCVGERMSAINCTSSVTYFWWIQL